ncbi:MAG: LysR family transcriptional regulator [Arachnia sp.]
MAQPDLDALEALVLVGTEASISAAAHRLGVSQQAVSLRLRGLEAQLSTRLVVRTSRGSRLSEAGELLVGWARPLLAAAAEFTCSVESLGGASDQTVRVAASLTIAEHLAPGWIARWQARRGDGGPVLHLVAANSDSVIAAVRAGEADLGFVETPTIASDVASMTIGEDRIEVVVTPNHPWARARNVALHTLAGTRLVTREPGSGTRHAFETAMAAAGFALRAEPAAVLETTLGVRSAIMAGTAPGALSRLAVADDVARGRLARVKVKGLAVTRALSAVWLAGSRSAAAEEFLAVATMGLRDPRVGVNPELPANAAPRGAI